MNTWCKVAGVLTLRDTSDHREESTVLGSRLETLHLQSTPIGPSEYVMFVHGYNVSQQQARESYAQFRWWLEHYQTPAQVLELHWPGDRKWGLLAAGAYPLKIDTAIRAGELLADWIAGRPAGFRLTLVGHSLGCRVVLEAIRHLRTLAATRPGLLARLKDVALMAAAVPVRYIDNSRLGPRASEAMRWHILFSRGDTILRLAFVAGQSARFDAFGGRAVGLHGHPLDLWKSAGDALEMFQEESPDDDPKFYNHGHYWTAGPERPVNEERCYWKRSLSPITPRAENHGASAKYVAKMLGGKLGRELPVRRLDPPRSFPERLLTTLY